MVASYKTKSESANKRLNQRCTEMESTWFLRFFFVVVVSLGFSSEAYGIEAFILHSGGNLPEENRLLYPKGSWWRKKTNKKNLPDLWNIVALQVPPISLPLPISPAASLEPNHAGRKERKWFRWAEEQSHERWHLYRINHSYQRERHSALWTETWYCFIQK